MRVFEIDQYTEVPDNFQKCSVCRRYHSKDHYINPEGERRTNCTECYHLDWDNMCELKKNSKILEQRNFQKYGSTVCENCDKEVFIRELYSRDPAVCSGCEEELDDVTGYCSMFCRLTGRCDDSC